MLGYITLYTHIHIHIYAQICFVSRPFVFLFSAGQSQTCIKEDGLGSLACFSLPDSIIRGMSGVFKPTDRVSYAVRCAVQRSAVFAAYACSNILLKIGRAHV